MIKIMGTKVKTEKKSLDQKKDFPKSLEPELNTEQPNFRPLIFSQPEKPASTAYTVEQHPKISTGNIQKKTNTQSPRNFMIISP